LVGGHAEFLAPALDAAGLPLDVLGLLDEAEKAEH
jgi:hypothetical protein